MLHVDIPTRPDLNALITHRGSACVSIYLPTTPLTQHAQADRIALKNMTSEAISQLAGHDKREVSAIEESLHDLIDDDTFWEFQANSLGVFVTPTSLRTFRLPNKLTPALEVSDRFHIKPLLRAVTVPQSAFVLALAQNSARVVEVTADLPAHEVKVHHLPTDAASAVGKSSIKDRSPSGRIQGSEGMKVRLAQYARKVDHALRDLLGGRETPLIIAAAEPLLSIYRSVNTYPHLASKVISTNPEELSNAQLADAARPVMDELFRHELAEIHALFEARTGESRTSTDIAQVAKAATYGAVSHLLVDIDGTVPGTVADNGAVTFAEKEGAANYDIVDEIAGRAILSGARVLGVRKADIPGGASLAAIFRYPF